MRREFPARVKVAAFERAGGRCENCGVIIRHGAQYDHRVADGLGGEPTLENCSVKCKTCHALKTTKHDIPVIAKSKRVRAKHVGADGPKGRPMPCGRKSRWKKKLDGSVVPR